MIQMEEINKIYLTYMITELENKNIRFKRAEIIEESKVDNLYLATADDMENPTIDDLTVPLRIIVEEVEDAWCHQKSNLKLNLTINNSDTYTYLTISSCDKDYLKVFSRKKGSVIIQNLLQPPDYIEFKEPSHAVIYILEKYKPFFSYAIIDTQSTFKKKRPRIKNKY